MIDNKIKGSFLALALGDALGAAYEGGILEKFVWKFLGRKQGKCRWTDDTQMSIDIMESLIEYGEIHQDDLARRFAGSYQWSRGYGPGAARILKKIKRGMPWSDASRSVYKDGSYGNGAAMRSGSVGLFHAAAPIENIRSAATKAAVITHAHPVGVEGAVLIAVATAAAVCDKESSEIMEILEKAAAQSVFKEKLKVASDWLSAEAPRHVSEVKKALGNGIAAQNSVVSAIYIALACRECSFSDMLQYTRSLGGDVDTIGAMAGSIWGAARGMQNLPEELLQLIEEPDYLKDLASRFAKSIASLPGN